MIWPHGTNFASSSLSDTSGTFLAVEISDDRLTVRILDGRKTILIWCRDKANNWRTELAEEQPPAIIEHAQLTLAPAIRLPAKARVRFYDPWTDKWSEGKTDGTRVALHAFSRSLVVKIER